MKIYQAYFEKFLKVAPFSLAVWRTCEAVTLHKHKSKMKPPLLDLGCGFGEFSGVFFNHQIDTGIDLSAADLKLTKRKQYRVLVAGDGRKMAFKNNSFETVVSISVLEHIDGVESALSEAFRVLRPGGYFILSVPTVAINDYFGPHLVRKFYVKMFHLVFKHVTVWSAQKWVDELNKAGFEHVDMEPTMNVNQLSLFEWSLLSSLPSQIHRILTRKRGIFHIPGKKYIARKLFEPTMAEVPLLPLNVVIVGRKP